MRFRVLLLAFSVLLAGLAPGAVVAQDPAVVSEIVIEGSQRIEPDTIRSYLLIQEGEAFDRRRIDRSLKSLFATGLFADVTIAKKGGTLIIKVVENPVINRIAFEGNRRISDEELAQEVVLRPRVVFTRSKVQKDVERILDIYRLNGRFAASVEPKVIQLDQNRANLVFEVDEGRITGIQKIRFLGNRVNSDSDLRSIIRTKESVWYRFFTSDDTYDPDRLTFDRELLRRFYLEEGYADFRVASSVAELTPDRDAFFITFTIDEGKRYKFGKIDIAAGLRGLDPSSLRRFIEFKEGDWFDNGVVDKAVDALTDAVGTMGYAFVEVRPRVKRNREKRAISIDFVINEGPRVFVERINISGNVRTIDKVIRREFRLVEGDAFNAAKLRRSRQRIRNLDYFEKVDIERIPGSAPDKAVINLNVEEKSTGSLSVGVGYSTDVGPLGDITIKERNLLGRGQTLALSFSLAAKRSQVNVGFTEPYFLDREIAAGFDVFHTRRDLQDTSSYDTQRTGFALRAGYPITERLRQKWRYSFELSKVENVDSNASSLIKAQEGDSYLSMLSHELAHDTTDSRLLPTKGQRTSLKTDFAGLGGTVYFLRNTGSLVRYFSLADEWILSTGGEVGYIVGLGEDVTLQHRYRLGGDNLRGFMTAGVGPRDQTTKDALGGEWVYRGRAELLFPLGLPNELGLKGKFFSDLGSLGGVSPGGPTVFDSASLRASAGAGVVWSSPFGPISVDVGFPLLKEDLDETEVLRVNFGARF